MWPDTQLGPRYSDALPPPHWTGLTATPGRQASSWLLETTCDNRRWSRLTLFRMPEGHDLPLLPSLVPRTHARVQCASLLGSARPVWAPEHVGSTR